MDHVCTFVERNQVKWLDMHNRPLIFDRASILKGSVITVDCLRAVQNNDFTTSMILADGEIETTPGTVGTTAKDIGNEFF